MTLSIREGSGLTGIAEVHVREGSGLTPIAEIWVREAGGLTQVFSAFGGGGSGLTATPASVAGSTSSHSAYRISTGSVTISVSPSGPVDSVAWSFADAGWDALSPASLTTAFLSPAVDPGSTETTTATCTVTRGAATASIDVPARAVNYGS